MTYPLWVVGGRPLVRGLDLGWGSETLRSHSLWDELVGGCLPFSVPKRNFCCAVSCALTIRSLGSEPGLLLFVQSRPTPHCLFHLSLFPGPELPKPDVISQLEQGAELWVAERGIAQGCCPGENPPEGTPFRSRRAAWKGLCRSP